MCKRYYIPNPTNLSTYFFLCEKKKVSKKETIRGKSPVISCKFSLSSSLREKKKVSKKETARGISPAISYEIALFIFPLPKEKIAISTFSLTLGFPRDNVPWAEREAELRKTSGASQNPNGASAKPSDKPRRFSHKREAYVLRCHRQIHS